MAASHGKDVLEVFMRALPAALVFGMTRLAPETTEYMRQQGRKGGRARAKKLSRRRRKQIAQKAARARWGPRRENSGKNNA